MRPWLPLCCRGQRDSWFFALLVLAIPQPAVSGTLVETYAPVWVQEIGSQPAYDLVTRFDFDGNQGGYDNVENASKYPLPAVVYGDVVAETVDSYYLFYGVYHIKDYDRFLRALFFPSATHDNDFEGLMLLVDKGSGQVLAMETWWHSKFLQYALSPEVGRTQTIDGALHLEDGTHPLVYVQAFGHGVRGLQGLDSRMLDRRRHAIYRVGLQPTTLKSTDEVPPFLEYVLLPLNDFVSYAHGPFDRMFSDPQDFGIGEGPIGKYLSGRFSGDSAWARPKPPWSWTDKFDTLRPGAWFFHPAHVFGRHFKFNRSQQYLRSLPKERMLKVDQATLDHWVAEKVPSYFNDIPKGPFHRILKRFRRLLFRLAEYLFYLLG